MLPPSQCITLYSLVVRSALLGSFGSLFFPIWSTLSLLRRLLITPYLLCYEARRGRLSTLFLTAADILLMPGHGLVACWPTSSHYFLAAVRHDILFGCTLPSADQHCCRHIMWLGSTVPGQCLLAYTVQSAATAQSLRLPCLQFRYSITM